MRLVCTSGAATHCSLDDIDRRQRFARLDLRVSQIAGKICAPLAIAGAIAPDSLQEQRGGSLDAAIVRREDDRRDGEVLTEERFSWFATPGFEYRSGEAIRLASLAPSCGVRNIATRALDAADIDWIEVFVGGGMTAIGAAVSAGLAVAALAQRVAPQGLVDISEQFGLPPLPSSQIVLHSSLSDPRSRGALRTIAAAFREHRASA